MKIRTVELYADLSPGWQDNPTASLFLMAYTNPSDFKPSNQVRVKITVELPEADANYWHDVSVKGTSYVVV